MTAILGLLSFGLLIALVVGLVKPALIMRWSKNPTRLKVFGLWILATALVVSLSTLSEGDTESADSKIKSAKTLIEQENFKGAISKLEDVKSSDPLYSEAKELLQKAESLSKMTDGEKQIAKEDEEKKKAEEEVVNTKEQLKREINSIDKGVNFSNYRGTVESLQIEIALFATWAKIINEAEATNDPEILSLAKQLKSKVSAVQVKEYPILRKEYTKIVASKMWENNIEVSSDGAGNKNLNFIGGIFANNKNKKDFQTQLHEVLTMFRFNQSRYRWYEGEDEYTYYTIYEGKDSDLVIL
jgi:uncharacterized FlaG/YvyC family protein